MNHLFDFDLLDGDDLFEIDEQVAHAFKHATLGSPDIYEVWEADPLFSPAMSPAHWPMVAEVAGRVLVVPLAPSDSGNPSPCRPIGCYLASNYLADQYRNDR